MKITSVDIIKLFKEPSEQCEIAVAGPWHPIIVRVNTDEGISGYGEIGLAYGIGQKAGFGIGAERILAGQTTWTPCELRGKPLRLYDTGCAQFLMET